MSVNKKRVFYESLVRLFGSLTRKRYGVDGKSKIFYSISRLYAPEASLMKHKLVPVPIVYLDFLHNLPMLVVSGTMPTRANHGVAYTAASNRSGINAFVIA